MNEIKHNSIQAQVEAWMEQLTVSEKCSLLSGSGFWHTQNIDRLETPKLMLTDGPHGLRKQGEKEDHLGQNESVPATCFPSEAGLAASWNREIAKAQGRAIGVECRNEDVHVILGPGLNIKRSPCVVAILSIYRKILISLLILARLYRRSTVGWSGHFA